MQVYKYPGVEINSKLNLNSDFDTTFNQASSRLILLHKNRSQLNVLSAKAMYRGMIFPILKYCGVLGSSNLTTQQVRLIGLISLESSFNLKIIFGDSVPHPDFPSVVEV